jgi:hypothetical protein
MQITRRHPPRMTLQGPRQVLRKPSSINQSIKEDTVLLHIHVHINTSEEEEEEA